MGRPDIFRALAIAALIGVFIATLFAINRRPATLAAPDVPGEHIEISGHMFDGDAKPVPDAVLELWQANSYGKYAHPEDMQDKPLDRSFTLPFSQETLCA